MKRPSADQWILSDKRDFSSGIQSTDTHSGNDCVYLKCLVERPKTFGYLAQQASAEAYIGKRIKMSGWVKTELPERSSAQLWLRVDGDWTKRAECFDNMYDARIKGSTPWSLYEVAVDVPVGSTKIWYGVLLNGIGQVWLDDVVLESFEGEIVLAGRAGARA